MSCPAGSDSECAVSAGSPPLSRLARFSALTLSQQRMLLAAWFLLPFFWLGLSKLGLARLHALLQRRRLTVNPGSALALPEIQALGEAVNIAARHSPFPATCLTRSLLLDWLLQRRGIWSQLRIGVRLTQGMLDAHAWVECEGVPVNDLPDIATQFASFGDLIPLRAFQAP